MKEVIFSILLFCMIFLSGCGDFSKKQTEQYISNHPLYYNLNEIDSNLSSLLVMNILGSDYVEIDMIEEVKEIKEYYVLLKDQLNNEDIEGMSVKGSLIMYILKLHANSLLKKRIKNLDYILKINEEDVGFAIKYYLWRIPKLHKSAEKKADKYYEYQVMIFEAAENIDSLDVNDAVFYDLGSFIEEYKK